MQDWMSGEAPALLVGIGMKKRGAWLIALAIVCGTASSVTRWLLKR